jgi:hypothetical protein
MAENEQQPVMNNPANEQCKYRLRSGEPCAHSAAADGLCFWHSPKTDKRDPEIKPRLEHMVSEGKPLEGFRLAHTHLEHINLVRSGTHEQTNLMDVDFYRANLQHGHFFNVNFSGGSLMKADLGNANLNLANLADTNLLGTKFHQTKLENVTWGGKLRQEQQAFDHQHREDKTHALRLFKEAEETYRHLQAATEAMGLFDNAGIFLKKRMIMQRYQLPLWSGRRLISKTVDLACGYGESPVSVIFFSLSVILFFGVLFFLFGIQGTDAIIRYTPHLPLSETIHDLGDCLYFSVVTFTTVGYGDIYPIGITRFFATLEAFAGSFILALFVVVFVNKMTR